ncbi:MAG: phosphatidylglycerophosphatase A [bacterium]
MVKLLASGFYISYIPVRLMPGRKCSGAGLWGSVLAMFLTPLLPENSAFFAIFMTLFLPFSVWICTKADEGYGTHDDPRIVLDEIAGYWTAMAFLERDLPIMLGTLVLFRLLDTLKPGPIRWLDRLPGGLGVVADDVAAGITANLVIRLALMFAK